MRFLFDQNLSPRLQDLLADLYPGSIHVRAVGLKSADDEAVWSYAAQHGLTIVSKDSDFRQRSFLFAHPPKVVWVRRGNCSTTEVEAMLRGHHDNLATFEQDEEGSFLALA
jgi:predicted nuclease of predicted toxin-antitoxin system|tara:strand:- start:163 stop:495 length:333 start_codon:yes stop_codon:yes gene_type:complete